MRKLSQKVDNFCYKHNKWAIVGLMRYIVLANAFVFLMDMFFSSSFGNARFSSHLSFIPYRIFFEGEIWRLLSFVAVPERAYVNTWSILWFMLSSLCYYHIGSSLEQRWGSARFTMFYVMGVALNLASGLFISGLAYLGVIRVEYFYTIVASMYYVNLSLFFSIATLYPNAEFRLWLIIPVKAKWLGWFFGAMFAYDILVRLITFNFALALVPILAIFNYFLFFWDDIELFLFKGKHRVKYASQRHSPAPINLKTAQKKLQEQKGYLHKCTICGATDASHPEKDFRYCSKCEGYHCYCMEHLNNHDHIQ